MYKEMSKLKRTFLYLFAINVLVGVIVVIFF